LSAVAASAGSSLGFVINGQCAADQSGFSVSSAGDVNGDGLADLIVGAVYALNGSAKGSSYVVFGKTSGGGIDLSAVAGGTGGFVINGQCANDQSGYSVSSAGDVNGDGLADLIVGANGSDPAAGSNAGRSYVVFGKTSGGGIDLSAVAGGAGGFVINGQCANDQSGNSVSGAGDVNGDGLADLIVGAYASSPSAGGIAGRSYVIFGSTGGAFSQTSVDWLGTANDDAQSDGGVAKTLVAGAGNDILTATAASVLYGGSGNDTFHINAAMISALQRPFGSGGNVSQLARIDGGTGTDTIVLDGAGLTFDLTQVANVAAGNPDGGSRISQVEVIDITGSGNNTLSLLARDVRDLVGTQPLWIKGNAGDVVNVDEIWLKGANVTGSDGLVYQSFTNSGATLRIAAAITANVFPTVSLSSIAAGVGGFVINGQCALDQSGYSVSSAGDVNGDGLADLIVGAYQNDPAVGTDAGRSYVVFGKTSGGGIELSAVVAGSGGFVINGQGVSDNSGYSVSSAGDVNGDGLADLIVGAYQSDPTSRANAGRSYVVFGKSTGTAINLSAVAAGNGGFVINGQAASDQSGWSVSSAGDVNGDGLSDLIVGANTSDPSTGSTDAGRSYVVFGKSTGVAIELSAVAASAGSSLGFVINGQCAADQSGFSVSSAGDVNGDGLADLIVGAVFSDPLTGSNAGRSYVVFGKTATGGINLSALAGTAGGVGGFVINGQCSGDQSGISVSSAGDVNGDGLADLIVGANLASTSAGNYAGRSYVVFGKTSGGAIDLSAVAGGAGALGFVINGQSESDGSGFSVSDAGDINGDGLADLIVGAFGGDSAAGRDTGRSYVVFGKTSGGAIELSAIAGGAGGFAINGQCLADASSTSVSGAGDVNGDGLADLIVGAPNSSPGVGGFSAGRSYVIFGSTGGAFSQTAVDWMGTDINDTHSDGGVASTLVGGAGNDTLTATAASVLYGGAGADTFVINSAVKDALQSPYGSGGNVGQLARIDGGTGIDTIKLSGAGITFDLTAINSSGMSVGSDARIESIEIIDITGTGNNTLKLSIRDVMDMSQGVDMYSSDSWNGRKTMVINGNAGDTLDLLEAINVQGLIGGSGDVTNWTKKIFGTFTYDFGAGSKTYQSYYVNENTPGQVTLYVDNTMTVL
jgi:hypothetical protein